ncbi:MULTISPECIES: MerR family transcriptional regulator [unclassified Leifsonia]|uniref:MerR family transcriptional regulator n=1 Tax=unclassified Leifsonia TaxID=2663824 RepID=UPI0008A7BB2B|nr:MULTISPECIES: MerR family transcriptional regulator [unclassified Leifsonia]SEI08004.1 MerR family transcriptional regulator, heat shock protein HspR [Leifsonia sp. CL154]SFL80000.1 MerR family transcriptional regulator, heat shock protein HspR [Leifsonia sp. CL147]
MVDEPSGTPLYSIAVAAELAGLAPATLRLYEEKGLLTPARTEGGTRRYSDADIARVRLVARLQEQGVNLTGVGRVIELQEENDALRRRLDRKQ